jgi:hypothetical protein
LDTLTFVSNVISSIVWPLVVAFIIVILRKPLRDLIADLGRRVRRIKYPGGEAEFSDELAELIKAADDANLPMFFKIKEDERQWGRLPKMSPRSAIIEAWRQVEITMREMARRFEVPERESRSTLNLIRVLGKRQILTPDIIAIIGDLRSVRNIAAHGLEVEITQRDATEYVALAERVIAKLHT